MYQNILVAIDGSDTAKLGLREAIKLAGGSRTPLRLVHVVNITAFALEYSFAMTDDCSDKLRAYGEAALNEAKNMAETAGLQAEVVLIETTSDSIGEALVKHAAEWPADIIVMGTHGRRGIGRMFLGSNVEYVLSHTAAPVLSIRSHFGS